MTIREAIQAADAIKPNGYPEIDKVKWLSTIDGLIKKLVIDTHEGGDAIVFNGYNENTSLDTELIAEKPYDSMYVTWLESKIDLANAEYSRYNNAITRFNEMHESYSNYYNRTHTPLGKGIRYW